MEEQDNNRDSPPFYFTCLSDGSLDSKSDSDKYKEDQWLISRILIDCIAKYWITNKDDIGDLEQQLWLYYTYAVKTHDSNKGKLSTHFTNICNFNLTEYFSKLKILQLDYKDYILLRKIRRAQVDLIDVWDWVALEKIIEMFNYKNTKIMRKKIIDLYHYEVPISFDVQSVFWNSISNNDITLEEEDKDIDAEVLRKWSKLKGLWKKYWDEDDWLVFTFLETRSFIFIEDKYWKDGLKRLNSILNRLTNI